MHLYSKFSIALFSLSISSFCYASRFYDEDDKFSTNSTWSTEIPRELDDGGQEDYEENTKKATLLAKDLLRSRHFVSRGNKTHEQHEKSFSSYKFY